MAIEMEDLPIKHADFPVCHVSLPGRVGSLDGIDWGKRLHRRGSHGHLYWFTGGYELGLMVEIYIYPTIEYLDGVTKSFFTCFNTIGD